MIGKLFVVHPVFRPGTADPMFTIWDNSWPRWVVPWPQLRTMSPLNTARVTVFSVSDDPPQFCTVFTLSKTALKASNHIYWKGILPSNKNQAEFTRKVNFLVFAEIVCCDQSNVPHREWFRPSTQWVQTAGCSFLSPEQHSGHGSSWSGAVETWHSTETLSVENITQPDQLHHCCDLWPLIFISQSSALLTSSASDISDLEKWELIQRGLSRSKVHRLEHNSYILAAAAR